MRPIDICARLGEARITTICEQLNSNQLKTTLRKGNLNIKVPSRMVSQKARRRVWAGRVVTSLAKDNEEVADNLLYEWLLHHRRKMLIEYLDAIGVTHQGGETEETFTKTIPVDQLLSAARNLAAMHPAHEVAAYVLYLDHHQESDVYTSAPDIVALLRPATAAGADADSTATSNDTVTDSADADANADADDADADDDDANADDADDDATAAHPADE